MNHIKMIVTDLDRTLLRSDKSISEYTKSVLNQCSDKGILLVFATARPERATKHLQPGIDIAYVIANNGATITSCGTCIHNILIQDNTKHELLARLSKDTGISSITVEAGDVLYTDDPNHKIWSQGASWNPIYTDFSVPINEATPKISVECTDEEYILNIINDYPELHVLPNSGEKWSQIMHRNSTKLNAISFLTALNDIDLESVAAFGDDYNDLEMIEKCGVGIAVENAIDEAKQKADYICGSNQEDGVAKYIRQKILGIS